MKGFCLYAAMLAASAIYAAGAVFWHPHGIALSGSVDHIRDSLLRITPLGTPRAEVEESIRCQLRPDTFYSYSHGLSLPQEYLGEGKVISSQWPRGGEHHGKVIGCEIGHGGLFYDVDADWAFDGQGRLADIFVYKEADLP